MKIYIGNMSYDVTENEIRTKLEEFGKVSSVNIIDDKYSGRSKGFGFAEMESDSEAQSAIESLNGLEFKGRKLNVNEAKPRTENRGRNSRNFKGRGRNNNYDKGERNRSRGNY